MLYQFRSSLRMAVCFHGPILSDEKARNGVDWASGLFNAREVGHNAAGYRLTGLLEAGELSASR
jgi:hypothetical protein